MTGENAEGDSRRQARDPHAVHHQVEDGRLSAASGIEPAMLIRLARPGRSRSTFPTPELGKVEPWPPREPADNGRLGSRRAGDAKQQSSVLVPVRKEDRTCQSGSAHQDVIGRRGAGGCHERERHNCSRDANRSYQRPEYAARLLLVPTLPSVMRLPEPESKTVARVTGGNLARVRFPPPPLCPARQRRSGRNRKLERSRSRGWAA